MNHRYLLLLFAIALVSVLGGSYNTTAANAAPTATFVINSLADDGDVSFNNVCATASGECTLRAAIEEANRNSGHDTITFAVTQVTIQSALPDIKFPVDILGVEGATCTGTGRNGINAGTGVAAGAHGLVLAAGSSGSTIRGVSINSFGGDGIRVESNNNTIHCNNVGVALNGYGDSGNGGAGIRVLGDNNAIGTIGEFNVIGNNTSAGIDISGADDTTILNNYIGVGRNGMNSVSNVGNSGNGISVDGGTGTVIGNGAATGRNIISANGGDGIFLSGTSEATVRGNYIGSDLSGTTPIDAYDNARNGIFISKSSNNTIGGANANDGNTILGSGEYGIAIDGESVSNEIEGNRIGIDQAGGANGNQDGGMILNGDSVKNNSIGNNVIAYNNGIGIVAVGNSAQNSFSRNLMVNNGGIGIDLGGDGPDTNDKGDKDGGDNFKLNYPEITSAEVSGNIEGTLDSANGNYLIEFYQNDSCDNSNFGEGQNFLGDLEVTVSNDTPVDFSTTFVPFPGGYLTALATDTDGNTSEFSLCEPISVSTIVLTVNSTGDASDADTGDGVCETAATNQCTLRAAIEQANLFETPVRIEFSTGAVPTFQITPNSPLPSIIGPTEINGLRNLAGTCSGQPNQGHALTVVLNGALAGGSADGLHFTDSADGSALRGLAIHQFAQRGILLESDDSVIECNHLGAALTGARSGDGNGEWGIEVTGDNNDIGGSVYTARNVISGNGTSSSSDSVFSGGIRVSDASSTEILGNYIGVSADGNSAEPNTGVGVAVFSGGYTRIGNLLAAEGNVISGNTNHGIYATGVFNGFPVEIVGNEIGRNQASTSALGNGGHGILIGNGSYYIIGGTGDSLANFISANGGYGVYVEDNGGELGGPTSLIGENTFGGINSNFGNHGDIRIGAFSPVTIDGNQFSRTKTNPSILIECDDNNCVDLDTPANRDVLIEFNQIDPSGQTPSLELRGAVDVTANSNDFNASDSSTFVRIGDLNGSPSISATLTNNNIGDFSGGVSTERVVVIESGSVASTLDGNLISGNADALVHVLASAQTISNNNIGAEASRRGGGPIGGAIGLHIDGADDSLIFGNVVGGNVVGLRIESGNGNSVYGNGIGTDTSGTSVFANSSHGIEITNGSEDNLVGGDAGLPYNQIRNNGGTGIVVWDSDVDVSKGNQLFANEFDANGLLAIDLGNDDVTLNDNASCDVDEGPNDKQNFPDLTGISVAGNVLGSLKSRPSRTYRIDVFTSASCDPLYGHGEGSQYFGSTVMSLGVSGEDTFAVVQSNPDTPLAYYTAIATDLVTGNTSEFSTCFSTGVPTAVAVSERVTDDGSRVGVKIGVLVLIVALTLLTVRNRRMGLMMLVVALVVVGASLAPVAQITPLVSAASTSSERAAPEEITACGSFDELLEDGSSAQSGSGIIVGAVAGTLTEDVRVSALVAPEPEPAYEGFATRVSDYYQLSAETNHIAPTDKPFLVGIPRPTGVMTDNLAVAILADLSEIPDVSANGFDWTIAQVTYNDTNDLLIFTVSRLQTSNLVFTLVEHPTFDLYQAPPASRAQAPSSVSFLPVCTGTACTDVVKQTYAAEVLAAYDNFVNFHGFRPPAMLKGIPLFGGGVQPLPAITPIDTYAGVVLDDGTNGLCADTFNPDGSLKEAGALGYYSPTDLTLYICEQTLPISGTMRETIRHELFHAIQWAYPAFRSNSDWTQTWVREGTAEAAAASINAPHTTGFFGDRTIRTTLLDTSGDELSYEGEQFWFYFLDEYMQPFGYLDTVFEGGAEPAEVDATIGNLGMVYWDWAMNHAHEHHNLTDGAFTAADACKTVNSTVTPSPLVPSIITHLTNNYEVRGWLQPLDTEVVKFEIQTIFGGRSAIISVEDGSGQNFANYKVYDSRSDGANGTCEGVQEGERRIDDLRVGQEFTVVVGNADFTAGTNYTVKVQIVGVDD